MDDCFINTLLEEKEKGHWVPSLEGNYHALLMAQGDVNMIAWWPRTWGDVVQRQTLLKKRYNSFKRIIDAYGVSWESTVNIVKANITVWNSLIKVTFMPNLRLFVSTIILASLF